MSSGVKSEQYIKLLGKEGKTNRNIVLLQKFQPYLLASLPKKDVEKFHRPIGAWQVHSMAWSSFQVKITTQSYFQPGKAMTKDGMWQTFTESSEE